MFSIIVEPFYNSTNFSTSLPTAVIIIFYRSLILKGVCWYIIMVFICIYQKIFENIK